MTDSWNLTGRCPKANSARVVEIADLTMELNLRPECGWAQVWARPWKERGPMEARSGGAVISHGDAASLHDWEFRTLRRHHLRTKLAGNHNSLAPIRQLKRLRQSTFRVHLVVFSPTNIKRACRATLQCEAFSLQASM